MPGAKAAGMKDLSGLNPCQREAVAYCDGPLLVLAGAGSGKTRVLAFKAAYLVSKIGIPPARILAVTFTNKAANEMRERVRTLLGSDSKGLQACTFHSYGLRFLQRNRDSLHKVGLRKDFVVFDRSDCRSVVKDILEGMNIDQEKIEIPWILDQLSRRKTKTVSAEEETTFADRLGEIEKAYEAVLKEQNAVDFDDLLELPLELMKDPVLLERERASLDWILVDEYQDVNRPQYRLLRKLVGNSGRIMVVGDPDQSIYGWRGADMNMILNFERDFPGAKTVVLDQNYRSTAQILGASNGLIRNNLKRKPKNLWTARDKGEPVKIRLNGDEKEEANFILSEIESLRRKGYRHGQIALLYRVNALSRTYEQAFLGRGIPYRVVRGTAFYERKEVKDVLSFMRLALNPSDTVSLSRVANIPPKGLGKKGVEELADYLIKEPGLDPREKWGRIAENRAGFKGKLAVSCAALGAQMKGILDRSERFALALRFIWEDSGYGDHLARTDPRVFDERRENVMELLSIASKQEGNLAEVLAEISLFTDLEKMDDGGDAVNLLTLHAAKGLEFPVVFMVGMEEGLFPHSRSSEGGEGVEEERRLCYVGMTRAEERLYMSGAESRVLFGSVQRNGYSRFLWEIPQDTVQISEKAHREERGNPYAGRGAYRGRWGW
jgi:DNA helicase-2/ATP-dependent DNA helicase PcrA